MNFSLITLGELLSSKDDTIKRNAFSILKQLQRERDKEPHREPRTGKKLNEIFPDLWPDK